MSKAKSEYYFNIHHRSVALSHNGQITKSPGHFYLSLQNKAVQDFFGKYPKDEESIIGRVVGQSKVQRVDEEYIHKKLYSMNPKYITTKKAPIAKVNYHKAMGYAASKAESAEGDGGYVLGFADCRDFVQAVWNAADLPFYFTICWTRAELLALNTAAATDILRKYESKEAFEKADFVTEGASCEEVAQKLNVSVARVGAVQNDKPIDIAPYIVEPRFYRVKITDVDQAFMKDIDLANTPAADNIDEHFAAKRELAAEMSAANPFDHSGSEEDARWAQGWQDACEILTSCHSPEMAAALKQEAATISNLLPQPVDVAAASALVRELMTGAAGPQTQSEYATQATEIESLLAGLPSSTELAKTYDDEQWLQDIIGQSAKIQATANRVMADHRASDISMNFGDISNEQVLIGLTFNA